MSNRLRHIVVPGRSFDRKRIQHAVRRIIFILQATEVQNKGHGLSYGAIHGHSGDINDSPSGIT